MAAQTTDQSAQAVGETASSVYPFTMFHTPLVLADKYLCQFKLNYTWIAQQGHIFYVPANIPVNCSFFAGNWIHSVSTPVPTTVNNQLFLLVIQFYFIDPLAFQAQNIP